MSGGGGDGGEKGRAAHGLEPGDFRPTGLRLEWGHEHSPDAFEVFALAVSRDGTTVAAGGASPNEPGTAHVRVWRLLRDAKAGVEHARDARLEASTSFDAGEAAPPSRRNRSAIVAWLRAENAVGALSVALDAAGSSVFAGMADGTLWGWDVATGALRFGASRRAAESREDSGTHPALARLPRRRRPRRNPFASAFAAERAAGAPEPRPIRRLLSFRVVPRDGDGPWSPAASPGTFLVGAVGAHGVFPVWDGATGEAPGWDAGVPGSFRDDPAFDEDGVCHVAMHPDGSRMYSTTVDAKALRAWDLRRGDDAAGPTGTGGEVSGRRAWQSPKLAVRDVYLAGLAALPRPPSRRGSKDAITGAQAHSPAPLLLATCAASMMQGTSFAEPNTPLRVVLVDAEDGREVRRFPVEGATGRVRFVDCASLTSGGGGTLLFLAHRDGTVWVLGASNGARVAEVHAHASGPGTSGHHRLLPACVARAAHGEFLYVATTDGACVHQLSVGAPATWTRATHARFPRAFKAAARALALSAHAATARRPESGPGKKKGGETRADWSGTGAAADPGSDVDVAAAPNARGESFASGSTRTPALWGEGFARLVSVEPAILELVVARMARLAHGCEVGEGL